MITYNIAYKLRNKEYYMTITAYNIHNALNIMFNGELSSQEVTMIRITETDITLRKDVKGFKGE